MTEDEFLSTCPPSEGDWCAVRYTDIIEWHKGLLDDSKAREALKNWKKSCVIVKAAIKKAAGDPNK